jgi:hypothetical protein
MRFSLRGDIDGDLHRDLLRDLLEWCFCILCGDPLLEDGEAEAQLPSESVNQL